MGAFILNKKVAEKLKSLLNLEKEPVAITWAVKEPKNMPREKEKSRFCRKVDKAIEGEVFYSTAEEEECFGGARYSGMKDPKEFPKNMRTGAFLVTMGIHDSIQSVQRSWRENIAIEPEIFSSILFAPLSKAEFTPDVIIIICNGKQAMELLHAHAYDSISEAMGAGVGPICSTMAARPYLTGQITYSFADVGSRRHMKNLKDEEVMISIPYQHLERIIHNLEELKKTALKD